MILGAPTHIANDNDPRALRPKGDTVGFRALLKEQELERRLQALELQNLMQGEPTMSIDTIPHTRGPKWGIMLSLLCTLLMTLAAAYCFYSAQSTVISVIALTALVWSALWTTFISAEQADKTGAQGEKRGFISEVSIIIATVAGLAIWVLASREWGLQISASDGIAGFAGLSVISAALLRSRLALLVSTIAGLAWLALYTQVPSINMISIWSYPLLGAVQLYLAGQSDTLARQI